MGVPGGYQTDWTRIAPLIVHDALRVVEPTGAWSSSTVARSFEHGSTSAGPRVGSLHVAGLDEVTVRMTAAVKP